MKTLKLQVGKTYRSREGEEVKIVRMGNMGWDYWNGNNGEWYYEGGKWSYSAEEHPKDLIEEVPEIRHTFTIANDVKTITIKQVGNRIVLEMIPEEKKEPKPGDVMTNHMGNIYIFKSVRNDKGHNVFVWFGDDGSLLFDGWSLSGRHATPEEAQLLFDALKKAGKRWNPQTMEVEDIKPKPGDVMTNHVGSVYIFKETVSKSTHSHFIWLGEDGRLIIGGMCTSGRPATSEEAQTLWDALKKTGKRWNSKTMQVEDIWPKPGDVMINESGSVYIFKDVVDNGNHKYFVWFGNKHLSIGGTCLPGRPATPEEAKLLFDALKKEGKRWNPKTMEVEEITEFEHIREWAEGHLSSCHYNHERIAEIIEAYLKYREGEK